MSLAILILLVILILFAVAEVRARRKHESIQTVIHAEVAELRAQLEKLVSK